ncbi:MAG TPA: hypothetical protein VGJ60_07460 [Chloroflexota bacterium]|jgi:hypothetical protein
MAEDVELFRVQAMRFNGPSATKGGWSDKVWAGVMLKRVGPATSTLPRGEAWRFVPVWGPTGGTLQHKPQPWTSATEATRRYEDELRKKQLEGYQPIEWRNTVNMQPFIDDLPRRMADPVTSGDTARKAWQTRKNNEPLRTAEGERAARVLGDGPLARDIDAAAARDSAAFKAANDALRDIQLDVPPRPKPAEEPPARGMRSVRRDMKLE